MYRLVIITIFPSSIVLLEKHDNCVLSAFLKATKLRKGVPCILHKPSITYKHYMSANKDYIAMNLG